MRERGAWDSAVGSACAGVSTSGCACHTRPDNGRLSRPGLAEFSNSPGGIPFRAAPGALAHISLCRFSCVREALRCPPWTLRFHLPGGHAPEMRFASPQPHKDKPIRTATNFLAGLPSADGFRLLDATPTIAPTSRSSDVSRTSLSQCMRIMHQLMMGGDGRLRLSHTCFLLEPWCGSEESLENAALSHNRCCRFVG